MKKADAFDGISFFLKLKTHDFLALHSLSRLQRPDSRVISHSGCVGENMPHSQSVLCPSNLQGRLRFS